MCPSIARPSCLLYVVTLLKRGAKNGTGWHPTGFEIQNSIVVCTTQDCVIHGTVRAMLLQETIHRTSAISYLSAHNTS